MAIGKKQHESELAKLWSKITDLECALARTPNDVRRTGRIAGTDSRYTVKAWYRRSSWTAFVVVIHHRPGQLDSVIACGEVDSPEVAFSRNDAEQVALSDLVFAAREAFLAAMRSEAA